MTPLHAEGELAVVVYMSLVSGVSRVMVSGNYIVRSASSAAHSTL